jgi:PKD repeat protein
MKKLAFIILACAVVPLQHDASGQQVRAPRLAYDRCFQAIGENGWETQCEVRINDGGTTWAIAGGLNPAWSPDGLRIAFDGNGYIQTFNRADGTFLNLTDGFAYASSPSWSRDGRIGFVGFLGDSVNGYRQGLFVMNADGSDLTHLTDNAGSFAWAPNGAAIAFARTIDGVPELYRMNADGSNQARLTYGAGLGGAISWSPDGARIAFNCSTNVCAINADGTNLVQLIEDPVRASNAIFSPVGGKIAFLTDRFGSSSELAVMEADGTVVRVAPGIQASHPSWSPDGASIAFANLIIWEGACNADGSPCGPEDEITIVNADGTGLTLIDYGHNPTWFVPLPGQPSAAFTYECTGTACQFDAAGSFDPDGTIASYAWKFGDGTTGSGSAPAHTYPIGARYEVTLTVTDGGGASDVTRAGVMANTPPVASFTVVCNGPTCMFDGSGSSDADGSITYYTWIFGDGSYDSSNTPSVTHTYPTGTFTATLYVADNAGIQSAPRQEPVTVVNAPPRASFTVTCTYLSCTADASASSDPDGPINHYTWNFGESPYSRDGPVVSYRYQTGGTYTITLTVADAVNQTSSSSQPVTVVAPPPPPVHVGDLDASSVNVRSTWNAVAEVEVHTGSHVGVSSVFVSGVWDDGTAASCTTEWNGRCVFEKHGLPLRRSAVTLTITGATSASVVYKASDNHDADGDSNGTTVTIRR